MASPTTEQVSSLYNSIDALAATVEHWKTDHGQYPGPPFDLPQWVAFVKMAQAYVAAYSAAGGNYDTDGAQYDALGTGLELHKQRYDQATGALPAAKGCPTKQEVSNWYAEVETLAHAVERWKAEHGNYPGKPFDVPQWVAYVALAQTYIRQFALAGGVFDDGKQQLSALQKGLSVHQARFSAATPEQIGPSPGTSEPGPVKVEPGGSLPGTNPPGTKKGPIDTGRTTPGITEPTKSSGPPPFVLLLALGAIGYFVFKD